MEYRNEGKHVGGIIALLVTLSRRRPDLGELNGDAAEKEYVT